ncbi:hypothetical protein KIN20_016346 [Parelaphostrongylus tenuis]|uniref:Uncharacterized protein n=1 Tax=Parelaphostrongylus tenuis TaxID=148309 RepID=A0AAD5MZN3_PARTN|nr:hypothetical protein KIN20_016346 [Parelaphostrongylus tenuis]
MKERYIGRQYEITYNIPALCRERVMFQFMKDFPQNQIQYCEKFSLDQARWNLYPNLNYSGLFYAIVNLLEVFPLITTGQKAIGEAVLDTLKALMMFMDRDTLEQLPLLLASQIGVLPSELDRQIVHLLADAVLPFSLTDETLIKVSVPGVLMLVLQQTNDPTLHTWIMESAMNCSPDIYEDLVQNTGWAHLRAISSTASLGRSVERLLMGRVLRRRDRPCSAPHRASQLLDHCSLLSSHRLIDSASGFRNAQYVKSDVNETSFDPEEANLKKMLVFLEKHNTQFSSSSLQPQGLKLDRV